MALIMKGLGDRIRSIRRARNMTLLDVAKETDIDQATLSRIENGLMTGTVNSHVRIAEVLGVKLTDLYEDSLKKIYETKEKLAKKRIESLSATGNVVAQLLASGSPHKKMMPVLLRIKGGSHTNTEEFPALSERFLFVVRGCLEARIHEEVKLLKTGDSLYFDASLAHSLKNPAKTEAQCLSVIASG